MTPDTSNNKAIEESVEAGEWHALRAHEVVQSLATLSDKGLTSEEAARRLEQFGPNALTEAPPPTFWKMLWDQFNNFVVIMLVVAALISGILGEWIDAAAIMAIVVLNAALGVIQERCAEQALAALRKLRGGPLISAVLGAGVGSIIAMLTRKRG